MTISDSKSQIQEHLLPTITVDSPKSLQIPEITPDQEIICLQSPPPSVRDLDGDDNPASSDSECPDIEGVKSLFLPNHRICSSPTNMYRELDATDFGNQAYNDMMAVYYGDPWAYYSPEMMDPVNVHDPVELDGEAFQLDDPPFDPISEEAEEELAEMHQSFTSSSLTTTVTTSSFEITQHPVHLVSRHISLESIQHNLRLSNHSHSCPLLVKINSEEHIRLPQVPNDLKDITRCGYLRSVEDGLNLKPVLEQRRGSFQLARIAEPPEVLADSLLQPIEMDLQAFAMANWNPNSFVDMDTACIITSGEVDEDGDADEEAMELPQMRRCQHFDNINQLITTSSPLYPLMEEEAGGECDNSFGNSALSDGQAIIHRWGRNPPQVVSMHI